MQVVIVDDHPVNLDVLKLTLELIDAQSTAFEDGLSALDYLAACETVPSLLIVDRMMPGLDGLEVVRRVRADPRFDAMRIVMATASGDEKDVEEGRQAGADDYLVKPFTPDELLELLRGAD